MQWIGISLHEKYINHKYDRIFKFKKNLVHFAAWNKHLGFYPTPSAIRAFQVKLSVYEGSKGAIKFPFEKPMPLELIKEMVESDIKLFKKK